MTKRKGKTGDQAGNSKKSKIPATKNATKQQRVIDLLQQAKGATLEQLCKVTSWQEQSVRGFLSGTIKKRLGLKLSSDRTENGERRYRIAGA
jgi:hypothetical protein